MFTGTDILKFTDFFDSEEVCKYYLFQIKWKEGFSCFSCGNNTAVRGRTLYHLRCKKCNYEESVTANTFFHKLKIPLRKAFGLIYKITIPNGSSSSSDLATEYKVNRKTAWSFAQKLRRALVSDDDDHQPESIDAFKVIDSLIICGGEKEHRGLQQVCVSISEKESPKFEGRKHVTVKCRLPKVPSKINCELLFGKFVKQNKDIRLWNFKTSFTGSHRRCSTKYLQRYVNEFYFKSSFRVRKDLIIHEVLTNLMVRKRMPVKGFVPK